MENNFQRLLITSVVAERLGLAEQTLRTWRMRGEGPPWIRLSDSPSGAVRYPEDGLHEWLESRERAIAC